MLSSDAAKIISQHRADSIVITTMTTIFTFADAYPSPLNIRCAPLMGGASSIGLGVALAVPERHVMILDGDGSLLMQLGSLATIAGARPRNLIHFVFENRVLYEGGGRIPIAGAPAVDFPRMAEAAGYPVTCSFESAEKLDRALPTVLDTAGPVFVRLSIDIPATPRWSNTNPHGELPDWWFRQLGDDSNRVRESLSRGPQAGSAA